MNRMELVEKLAEKNQVSKAEVNRILGSLLDEVVQTVQRGESVTFVGFGTFKVSERPDRTGRNPANGQPINIPASKAPKFVPSSVFKKAVNGK